MAVFKPVPLCLYEFRVTDSHALQATLHVTLAMLLTALFRNDLRSTAIASVTHHRIEKTHVPVFISASLLFKTET